VILMILAILGILGILAIVGIFSDLSDLSSPVATGGILGAYPPQTKLKAPPN